MPLPPRVIDELLQKRARRDGEDRARLERIELSQFATAERADESALAATNIVVAHISPVLGGGIAP